MDWVRRRAVVRGEVQGVGFRMNARSQARSLRLSGFARNLANGAVEVEAEGPDDAVGEFIAWLRKGPRFAAVTSVTIEEQAPTGSADASRADFEVR